MIQFVGIKQSRAVLVDDLLASVLLVFNVLDKVKGNKRYLSQFFTVFFVFKLIPLPLNLHVLFVTGDDFCLDGIGSPQI